MSVSNGEVTIPIPKKIGTWIKNSYPMPHLDDLIFSRGIVPIDMGLVAVSAATVAEIVGIAQGAPPIPKEQFFEVFRVISPALYGLLGLRTALSLSRATINVLDDKNRIDWPILSVIKQRVWNNFLQKDFPHMVEGEQFYGEMHFSNWNKKSKFPGRKETIIHGLNELHGLIELCEKNDERLEGIHVFAGHSPMLHPNHMGKLLQQFGFDIKENNKPDYRGWDAWINGEYRSRKRREDKIHFVMPKAPWWSGVVQRDVLVSHKTDIEALRNRLRRNYEADR